MPPKPSCVPESPQWTLWPPSRRKFRICRCVRVLRRKNAVSILRRTAKSAGPKHTRPRTATVPEIRQRPCRTILTKAAFWPGRFSFSSLRHIARHLMFVTFPVLLRTSTLRLCRGRSSLRDMRAVSECPLTLGRHQAWLTNAQQSPKPLRSCGLDDSIGRCRRAGLVNRLRPPIRPSPIDRAARTSGVRQAASCPLEQAAVLATRKRKHGIDEIA
jgi:hypothetical protein